ncbi:hypothetical protein cypCar_00026836 [Cyprinus carpio]|nr:hypothetical protein cypCar_00026836 [Cyprinus carpio]
MFLAACRKSWWSCARGHTHRLTVSTAATCHYRCKNSTPANLPLRNTTPPLSSLSPLHREVSQRSEHLFSVICGSKVSKHHLLLSSRSFSLYGTNRSCTEASRKPVLEEKSSEKGEDQAASSSAADEGHFQFKELYENPWTIPNYLCMARILLSPVLGYLIMEQYFHVSLGLFVLAGATDLLDGYIARNWPNQKSALGSALDPLADKILISILYVSLTCAQLIPGRPCVFQINTGVQLFLVAASLAAPVFHYTDSVLLQSLWYITALTTAASGYSYYHYGKKTVEVLNNTK